MNKSTTNVLIGAVAVLVVLSMSMFVVDQRQSAIVFQLGEAIRIKTDPGLGFKIPLVQNVRFFDSRILTLDTVDPERFITAEKKNVMVDSFIKWRIVDVKQYYISVGGDEERGSGSIGVEMVKDGVWIVDARYNAYFGPVNAGIGGLLKDRDNVSLTVKRTF